MSINSISGTISPLSLASANANATSESNAAGTSARTAVQASDDSPAATVEREDKPAPLRFPWLSRLSTQLAAASKTPVTFSAPVLGDNVNKQA